jgi:hypothetical protein
MEHIYYTQCPVGYGLGASNGFQVKRITPGYPVAGDFRHLGLRAFPGGGRVLAPPALRYRRVGETAEVAYLTPRAMEYETERGLWGRPGGHFAHGVILTREELRAVDNWPAGLYGAPCWRRADPEPSRGREPDPVTISREDLLTAPDFASVVSLAEGLGTDLLARLLAGLFAAAREGRTLFLIDEPDRLGPRVALLTFLVPRPLRAALTFSTYHDRPEELPGYRIHGTTPASRPNRALLLTQGIVAYLSTGAVEPRTDPPAWSVEVASWVANGLAAAWGDFGRRLAAAGGSHGFTPWDDGWLDRLVSFGKAVANDAAPCDWGEEVELAAWSARSNLSSEWATARGPDWWRRVAVEDGGRPALLALANWPDSWKLHPPRDWGEVVARWFVDAGSHEREDAAVAFARGAPSGSARFAFVQALRRHLPEESWAGVRGRLEVAFADDPRTVTLWAVPEAVAAVGAGHPEAIRDVAEQFARLGESAEILLEAARVEAEGVPDRIDLVAEALADWFERPEALRWALRRGDGAAAWIGPWLRRRLALPDDSEGRRSLLDATPAELRPSLARAVLDVASDPGLPDDAFVWGVDEVLLAIPDGDRPGAPEWPGQYIERAASDMALITRIYDRNTRSPALRAWLDAARSRGDLGPGPLARLAHVRALAKALDARNPAPLEGVDLARIPAVDRGQILARLLRRDAAGSADSGPTLEHCGAAWPESLRPGVPDVHAIAKALADSDLLTPDLDPESWFHRARLVRDRLDPATPDATALGPEGLVAHLVASRCRRDGPTRATWALRSAVANSAEGWRAIAEDLRLDLLDAEPEASPGVVERWDRNIPKSRPERFWEVALNVCDGRRLAAVVEARAADLASLGPMSWWDHAHHIGSVDDLRDAFARLAPLGPIDEQALSAVQNWMERPRGTPLPPGLRPWFSPLGRARWVCLDRLSKDIFREGITDQTRRFGVLDWTAKLPLSSLPIDDRYRMIAWVLFKIEDPSALDVDRVGHWLVGAGLIDVDRLLRWPDELAGLADVSPRIARDRAGLVRELRDEMGRVLGDERARRIRGEPDSAGPG